MSDYSIAHPTEADSDPFPGAGGLQFDLLGSLGLENMRMRMWYFEPDGASTLHRHGVQEEVYHFLDGPAEVQVGDGADAEVLDVEAGDTVKVDPAASRQIRNVSGDTLQLLAVSAPNEMEGEIWNDDGDEWVPLQEWFAMWS